MHRAEQIAKPRAAKCIKATPTTLSTARARGQGHDATMTIRDSGLFGIYLHGRFFHGWPLVSGRTHTPGYGGVVAGNGPSGPSPRPIPGVMCASSSWKAPPGWRKLRLRVFARYGRACWRCGAWAGTVDHVLPVVLGGSHDLSNL